MPRIHFLLCSGFCLITITATAQSLPGHPTSQQIAGYQLYQQQKWFKDQQPTNSVLYQKNKAGSVEFTFGKKENAIPLFQTPVAYAGNSTNLKQGNPLPTVRKKNPPVGQFSAWKNSSKWRYIYDGGGHLGLISFGG